MASQEESHTQIGGINYYTLLNHPPPGIPRKNETILLVHALMSNLHMYDHTVQTLTNAGYTCLRFDFVGHGKTPAPAAPDFSIHLDDITRHMHELVEGKPIKAVIGCSVGGVLALRYAMLFPKDVEKVVAIAAPGIVSQESSKPLWSQRISQLHSDVQTGSSKLATATVNRWFPAQLPQDDAIRSKALSQVKTCSFQGYKIMADAIRNYDYTEEVREIKEVRVLVVAGSEDSSVSPGLLKNFAAEISGAKFVKMEGAGHLPPMHKVEEFEGVVVPWLEG